jgi:hypothetical protein
VTAACVVAFELLALAVLRSRFFQVSFVKSLAHVTLAGAIIAVVGTVIGSSA